MLISIYVTLPLFVGFAGLMFIYGLDSENYLYTLFAFVYMLNLEINLSLPLLLMPVSALIFYIFIKDKLNFLKMCKVCIAVLTVVIINGIYFFSLASYDFITEQSSVNYDSFLLFSILYDIIAAVLI